MTAAKATQGLDGTGRARTADRILVHGIGWLGGWLGYNIHARSFFSALARHVPTIASTAEQPDSPCKADQALAQHIFADRARATVALLYGSAVEEPLRAAQGRRIAYTVWESTRLPAGWVEALRNCDEVWTTSTWGASVFARNGLDPSRVRVVPEGVDPEIFNPDVPATDILARRQGFKFLHVGRFEDRKGTRQLLRAFDKAFGPDDEAVLVLSCHNPFEPDFDIAAELRALDLRHPENLLVIPPVARHDVFAGLYTACDAFVAPTRAEGWGLPICEAMACGLPVIATGYSAPVDYLGPESYWLDHRLVPVATPFFDADDGDLGMWAEPDFDHLVALLREVRWSPEDARRRGAAAGARIRKDFSWDASARTAATLLWEALE